MNQQRIGDRKKVYEWFSQYLVNWVIEEGKDAVTNSLFRGITVNLGSPIIANTGYGNSDEAIKNIVDVVQHGTELPINPSQQGFNLASSVLIAAPYHMQSACEAIRNYLRGEGTGYIFPALLIYDPNLVVHRDNFAHTIIPGEESNAILRVQVFPYLW